MPILTRKQRLKLSEQQSDPFATQAGPSDDPFATTATAPSPADEIAATPTEGSDPDIPVVNREGEEVAASDAAPTVEQEQPAETQQEPQEAPEPSEEAAPQGDAAEAPQEAQEAPQQPQESNGRTAVGPRGGKGELRYYKIAYQTGPSSWEFHTLDTVPEGVETEIVEGEKWVKARNNEHALRLGYAVLGAPQDGVTVWPVPKGAYKPKRVKPAPPKPERTRLVIG